MPETEKGKNSNIELIMGDYKQAILRLAWPMMISMALTMAYNLADSIWVAGLGSEAISALGFISPIFMILVGLGNGVGTGANSVIARYIGSKDYDNASNTAMHSLVLAVIISIICAVVMLIILEPLLSVIGASGENLQLGLDYGYIIFGLMIVFVLNNVATGVLRSEGDVKRAMYVMVVTAILNIILDPIFIYILDLGIKGAAWATIVSSLIACLIQIYWLFIKKDTFLEINYKKFKFNRSITTNILNIAIPSTSETLILSGLGIVINYMLTIVSGSVAVAVYTVDFRLLQLGMVPMIGLGSALLTVAGASYGAKDLNRLDESYKYALRTNIIIGIIITVLLYIFAPQLSQLFAYGSSAGLAPLVTDALHIMCIFCIGAALGVSSTMLFQGVGKGFTSLTFTFIRSFICEVLFSYIFAFVLEMGETGIYYGVGIGCIVGGIICVIGALGLLRRLKGNYNQN
ncbi:MAG: MATE family efflux transporter [Methanosphaera sp.]|nr:MATE family efflux transporter [Methanosphaera sp.]